jgi:RNA polymerase sigma-70 factor (ECF subfamily)
MFPFGRNKYGNMSDADLITAYKDNSSSGVIGELYERYAHLVMGTCMKYLKNKLMAEDLMMNIFEDLPKKILKHDILHFKSWLYRVTKNECLMYLRKQKIEISSDDLQHLEEDQDSSSIQLKEIKLTILEGTLTELKDEQRTCLELFYLKDRSYQEISDELNIDIKQVKSAIQNGKRNLKLKLEGHNEFKNEK